MMQSVWEIEYDPRGKALDLEAFGLEALCADGSLEEQYVLVAGEQDVAERAAQTVYTHARIPKAGAYVDCGGAVVYVDDNARLAETATDVLRSLVLTDDEQALAALSEQGESVLTDEELADEALLRMGRRF